ncbi:diaminopropionate ammonia-lyase [Cribrihabitans marinus]|uniref:Diaminopropionate ammonia-lyase n=1 Tax=Cribrihabitans marinus TaxID=1227549 RepID=A0A1H6Z8R7_9RHOB|nr:pyridoxal-phosphate dependent enzyme [Cribrihabitans marinus]GGH31107.1 diaminopropionate ammonia-lyase [Cribrihabitans marinus]SEJ49993.1 diaminopropionate ammonia-lyase [Cribrihabitans marinus]
MPQILANPLRGTGLPDATSGDQRPSTDAAAVARLLALCPAHAPTPLIEAREVAARAGAGAVWIKDERGRMGLGSFKALGAAYVIAHDAAAAVRQDDWQSALAGRTYVTASAGNHGLSVAAGARLFGAQAVIYLAETVPEAFAARLRDQGARVERAGATYEDSMAAAEAAAEDQGWSLLSDSTWPGCTAPGRRVMEGYLQMAAEAADQMPEPPSHILLQAGVGGLAAAVAAHARAVWGDAPIIIVVEPAAAPALIESIRAGRPVTTAGPVSSMGRLDCKTPSLVALVGLARDADIFATITEAEAADGTEALAELGFATTPSGGAGLAALLAGLDGIDTASRVLAILSEGPEDG